MLFFNLFNNLKKKKKKKIIFIFEITSDIFDSFGIFKAYYKIY